ncbi:rifin [Plasmodium falciparum IGH-CR14]|uniref:Rifin n=1 Tax=Plasmodium falciparum IGH-CR14 TaxID=580059 RepID=A0A0L1I6E6_PLAFA|nr:rifin [Plasmodium falciparum IGH-CR14]
MKVHYTNILLFYFPLNILWSSSYVHNKNKPYITPHTPTTTSRVLSECDIQTSIYDNDPEMRSVKENFDRQASQRFEEYEERMSEQRQKCKEQCEKDIQQIILKDKVQKSLEEKVEKGCLMCACGLGGVATSVGLLGTAVVNELKRTAMAAAIDAAIDGGASKGAVEGAAAGVEALVQGIKSEFLMDSISGTVLKTFFHATNYTKETLISEAVYIEYRATCVPSLASVGADKPMCTTFEKLGLVPDKIAVQVSTPDSIKRTVETIVSRAKIIAGTTEERITENVTAEGIKINIAEVNAIYASCQNAIIASTVAMLIIVLVMVIIYLILRYRRKKKMKKKLQYIKLLKE